MSCTNSKHKSTSTQSLNVKDIKDVVSKYDSMFRKRDKRSLKVYVQTKGSNHFVQVTNFSAFPNDVTETLNVIYNNSGTILALKDIPTSESGDYFNTITYYFYDAGNTMAYKTNSSFFSENCKIKKEDDSRVTEIMTLYFDKQFNTLGKDYSLLDSDHNKVDSSKCTFNYRIDIKPLKSASIIPQLKHL